MSADAPSFVSAELVDLVANGTLRRTCDASLVLADVSGFTPLTERYAKRGRIGSEALTDLVNSLFGPTLDSALGAGGDLLSFGGDALLVMFEGDGHRERAAAAAVEMQTEFNAQARRARVNVSMSVGVASGDVHLHIVGARGRALIAHGPAVERCIALESTAAPGEVLAEDGPVSRSAAAAGSRGSASQRRTRRPRADLVHRRATPPGRLALLDPYIAAAVEAGATPEHRRSVVAFLRYDIDASAPADEVDALLRPMFAEVERACAEFDVTVLNSDVDRGGGKFTLAAGVPFTTGDDTDRMLGAACAIVDGCDPALAVRIGVSEGPVFAGPVGSPTRVAYTIMGDDVNLAARVAARASPRTVLATQSVLDRSSTPFAVDHIDPFTVKGKTDPVLAARVGAAEDRQPNRTSSGALSDSPGSSPLYGRDAVIEQLQVLLTTTGHGAVQLIGAAGLGKSRVVSRLLSESGVDYAVIEAGRYLSATPYGAIAPAILHLLGVTERSSARRVLTELVETRCPSLSAWLPFIGVPLGLELPGSPATDGVAAEFRRRQMHRVFGEFLGHCIDPPVLLVVEDAHWLDEASADLLDSILPSKLESGWAVLATRRDDPTGWRPSFPSTTIELGPLDTDAATAFANEVCSDRPLTNLVVRRLVDRSDGNPLFLSQLVAAVADGADVDELPDRVEVLIEARMDRLTAEARSVLRGAAVLGQSFELWLIESMVHGAAQHLSLLGEFLESDDDVYRFRHALYRDTAYVALSARVRKEMHTLAAEAIELRHAPDTHDVTELLAEHWDSAGEPELAWPHLRLAARHAATDHAPFEASRFLERAVQGASRIASIPSHEIVEVYEELGHTYELLGRFEEAEGSFRRARKRSTAPTTIARLLGGEARVARATRDLSTAIRRYRKALKVVPADDHLGRSELLVGLSSVLERQGRHREKFPLLEAAVDEATRSGDVAAIAHAHLLLGNLHGDLGRPGAVDHFDTALNLYTSIGHLWGVASSRNNLGVECYYEGRWNHALDHYGDAADGYRRLGDETNVAMTLNNIGEIHSDQGRWEDAAIEFEEARRMWKASAFGLGVGLTCSNLGRLAARKRDFTTATAEFAVARTEFESISAHGRILELDARVADAALRSGDPAAALRLARQTLRSEELQPTVRCELLRTCAVALDALGRTTEADLELSRARIIASASGADYEMVVCEVAARDMGRSYSDPGPGLARLGISHV